MLVLMQRNVSVRIRCAECIHCPTLYPAVAPPRHLNLNPVVGCRHSLRGPWLPSQFQSVTDLGREQMMLIGERMYMRVKKLPAS